MLLRHGVNSAIWLYLHCKCYRSLTFIYWTSLSFIIFGWCLLAISVQCISIILVLEVVNEGNAFFFGWNSQRIWFLVTPKKQCFAYLCCCYFKCHHSQLGLNMTICYCWLVSYIIVAAKMLLALSWGKFREVFYIWSLPTNNTMVQFGVKEFGRSALKLKKAFGWNFVDSV